MSVSCESSVLLGRSLCADRSLVQRNLTKCGVYECDPKTLPMRRPRPTGAVQP